MTIVKEICENFITSFIDHNIQNIISDKLIHDEFWKESEEKIADVIKEVLILLEDIWINLAFNSELAKLLNEGTYQSIVILLSIWAILKNLPFKLSLFINISEWQSIASANRKGEGQMERWSDIIYVVKYLNVFFELMYVECSQLYYNQQKKIDDKIKLWRESNNDMFWVHRILKSEKDQFEIVGVQVAENMLHLNVLIRDKANVHRYFHLQLAEIPMRLSDVGVVTKFVKTLLLL